MGSKSHYGCMWCNGSKDFGLKIKNCNKTNKEAPNLVCKIYNFNTFYRKYVSMTEFIPREYFVSI